MVSTITRIKRPYITYICIYVGDGGREEAFQKDFILAIIIKCKSDMERN